jgi:hypothetical protein
MKQSFRDQKRRHRVAAAFANLYRYAKNRGLADPKKSAEEAAQEIHGEGEAGTAGRRSAPRRSSRTKRPAAAEVPRLLEDRTKEQLYARAQELDIEGRSQMTKDELIAAIRKR